MGSFPSDRIKKKHSERIDIPNRRPRVEPIEGAGLRVVDLDELTGLPEYRNSGLLVDAGALRPKQAALLTQTFAPGDEAIVEWRALTVALLARIGQHVRLHLGMDAAHLPLVKVLEAGTWFAGRVLASEVMVPNSAIRNLIREDKLHQIYSQMQIGQSKFGMQTMNQSLCSLYLSKTIALEEAMGHTSEVDELKTMILNGGGSLGNLAPPNNPTARR